MANTTYISQNRLTLEARAARKRILLIFTPLVILLSILLPFASWLLLLMLALATLHAGTTKRAGAKGEDNTLALLASLPDSYTLFNQIRVPNSESRTGNTECDFIVVGPNGVFIIEVKNNNSRIVGCEHDREWTVHKVGRRGTPYTSQMRNPIRQLKSQIMALKNYHQTQGYQTWIEGMVFFSNHRSHLELTDKVSVPVFHCAGLTEYILNYQPKYPFRHQAKTIQTLIALKQGR